MIESLPIDTVQDIFRETDFPHLHYLIFRHVSRHFAELLPIHGMNHMTLIEHIAETPYIRLIGWAGLTGYAITSAACTAADHAGNLPMLKHLRKCNVHMEGAPVGSAAAGRLDIIQWVLSCGIGFGCATEIARAAALNGHLNICQFLRDNYSFSMIYTVCIAAVDATQQHIMRWVISRRQDLGMDMCHRAYATDNIKSAKYLAGRGITDHRAIRSEICKRGSLPLIAWRIECGDNLYQFTCDAILHGHTHVLTWLEENGYY